RIHHDADRGAIRGRNREPGILKSHAAHGHGELSEAHHAPRLFRGHVRAGIEAGHLAGDPHAQGRRVKGGDGTDAGDAGGQVGPEFVDRQADRAEDTQTRDNSSSHGTSFTSTRASPLRSASPAAFSRRTAHTAYCTPWSSSRRSTRPCAVTVVPAGAGLRNLTRNAPVCSQARPKARVSSVDR